jgi:hypothetical protein
MSFRYLLETNISVKYVDHISISCGPWGNSPSLSPLVPNLNLSETG